MKIIVTGCFGFIGFNFIKYIFKNYPNDFDVTGIDNLNNSCSTLNKEMFTDKNFTHIDLNINEVNQLENKDYDMIINFAAESHEDNSISDPASFVRTNTLGALSLLNYAKSNNIDKFIHISTDEVYGSSKTQYFEESDKFNPSSPYSASKASAEHLCNAFKKTYGQKVTILRPCNNYGIYQQPEKMIPFSILNLVNDKNIEVYGDGRNVRNWIHVNDTSNAILHMINNKYENEVFNVSTDFFISNYELSTKIANSMGFDENRISFIDDRPGHDFRYAASNNNLIRTGWKPQYNFDESLKEIIHWYMKNTKWWNKEFINTNKNRKKRFNLN